MDGEQRTALREFVRQTVGADLDELAAELGRLRREVVALERMVGLPGEPPSQKQRQAQVAELRQRGYSTRAIAQMLHTDRGTVMKDCRRLGLPPAEIVIGLDGRAVRGPRSTTSTGS